MNRSQFQFVVLSTFYRLFIGSEGMTAREREGKNKKKEKNLPKKQKRNGAAAPSTRSARPADG